MKLIGLIVAILLLYLMVKFVWKTFYWVVRNVWFIVMIIIIAYIILSGGNKFGHMIRGLYL